MKAETAVQKIFEIEEELRSLYGPCNRQTVSGRKMHNRKSTLYRRRKNMLLIVERTIAESEKPPREEMH